MAIVFAGHAAEVNTVSAAPHGSGLAPHWIVSGGSDGVLRRWDIRQPASRTAVFCRAFPSRNILESAILSDETCVALVDNHLCLVDWRKPSTVAQQFSHSDDLAAIDWRGAGVSNNLLVQDDGGKLLEVDRANMTIQAEFGGHTNIGCGAFRLPKAVGGGFLSLGMDCLLKRYDDARRVIGTAAVADFARSQSDPSNNQMVNPPLPSCMDCVGSYTAVARGDGMFAIAQVMEEEEKVAVIIEAPAHASNSLSSVQWCNGFDDLQPNLLLTAAVSGEVFIWSLKGVLASEDEDADPEAMFSFSVREDGTRLGSAKQLKMASEQPVSLNAASYHSSSNALLLGDDVGRLIMVPVL